MKLSTRARYGTRALMELAFRWGQGLVPLKEIARRQDLSESYLARLFAPLVGAGIVKSTRGPRGGVMLAKDPQEVRLSEVIRLLEGSIMPVDCVEDVNSCPRVDLCATREIWDELNQAMTKVLEGITLRDLVERQKQKERRQAGMYQI